MDLHRAVPGYFNLPLLCFPPCRQLLGLFFFRPRLLRHFFSSKPYSSCREYSIRQALVEEPEMQLFLTRVLTRESCRSSRRSPPTLQQFLHFSPKCGSLRSALKVEPSVGHGGP